MSQAKVDIARERSRFYQKIDTKNLTPLCEVLHALVSTQPQAQVQPEIWHYSELHEMVMEASGIQASTGAGRIALI